MKTEVTKENRELVRELVANLRITKPVGDQLKYRVALCRKIWTELDRLESTHWLRLYEALAAVDFPEPDVAALRDQVSRRLATRHKLREMRDIIIPRLGQRPVEPCPQNTGDTKPKNRSAA